MKVIITKQTLKYVISKGKSESKAFPDSIRKEEGSMVRGVEEGLPRKHELSCSLVFLRRQSHGRDAEGGLSRRNIFQSMLLGSHQDIIHGPTGWSYPKDIKTLPLYSASHSTRIEAQAGD